MKILEPVEKNEIPASAAHGRGPRASKHDELYERVLQLNGLALPVKFQDVKSAEHFRAVMGGRRSKGRRLGLAVILRDKTVFVYKP